MQSIPKKTCELIVSSGNDYIGALKGNQSGLLADVEVNFTPQTTYQQLNKGHGRIEKRSVSINQTLDGKYRDIKKWRTVNHDNSSNDGDKKISQPYVEYLVVQHE